jgi:L-idonate 5-dehydrogenase
MRRLVIHAPLDLRVEEDVESKAFGPNDVLVRIGAGGICGSDLHYYRHGGFGTVRIKEPMVLGHEVAGTVTAVGDAVTRARPGDRVAVNPSRPCGACDYCSAGRAHHCLDMRFYGSAMRFPHVQGAFRDVLVCHEAQAVPIASHISLGQAAFAEPLAVCLHAVQQSGGVKGKRVLVTGCGPIGCLLILAARYGAAREIVATDVVEETLAIARTIGADQAINAAATPEKLTSFAANKGTFDVGFEASGSADALTVAINAVKPDSTIVQVGLSGSALPIPINLIVSKEVSLRGSFRFHEEFAEAANAIGTGQIDVTPLLSRTVPLQEAISGFELASDRRRAMKVQLAFD